MSELKKLFRVQRILAMVLAITLAVTSIPVTALAAEADAIDIRQTAQDAEDTSEKDDALDADAEDDSVQNNVQDTEDTSAQDDDASDGTEESSDPGALAEGDGTQEPDPVPAVNAEERADVQLEEPKFEGIKAQTSSYMADGASPVADETGKKLSMDFLSNYDIIVNGESKSLGALSDPVISTITYQWFAGENALGDPKKLNEEGSLPVDAGSYTVKFVLPAKENEYKSAEFASGYEITKSDVAVTIDTPDTVPVGTKWSEVPMPSVISVIADNGKSFTYVVDDKSTEANEADNNEVEFAMEIKDAMTGIALSGDQTLVKNGEYVISMVPGFIGANKDKYEKNYTWKHCDEQKLLLGNLKATRLILTPDASYGAKSATVANDDNERTVQIIEAASFTKEMQELKYTAALEAEDGRDEQNKPKWKAIEGQTVGEWYTAASYSEPWTEKDTIYCSLTLGGKLDTVPTIPGTYVYRISYEGDKKEYDASYADIVVVVAAAEIMVRPTVPANVTFYDGQTVKDVLSQITYELPYADGRTENGKEVLYPQKSNMWGTSYDDKYTTQPYKPDFELIEIIKDKEGKETNRTVYGSNSVSTIKLGNDYIVQFTGRKNVYYASGYLAPSVDINAGVDSMDPMTCGFRVRTDQSTLEAETNTCKLEVAAKDKAIDVTEIEKAATDKAEMSLDNVGVLEGAYTKIYDGTEIFEFYADYRKAKLVSGTSNPYSDFTYTWQRSTDYYYEDLLKTHQEEGKDVADVSKEDLENGIWGTVSAVSPYNAGIYRLHITYDNSRSKGFADPVDIYFVIKPQEITLTFNKTELVGNVGNDIDDFITNHAQELNEGTIVTPSKDQPAKAEDWKNKNLLSTAADYAYQVSWDFYQKVKETNADGQEVDKFTQYFGSLQSGAEYFLGVSAFDMGHYNPKIEWLIGSDTFRHNYSAKTDIYIPITVKEMGTDAIVFDGITTGGREIERTKTYDAESIYALIKDDLGKLNTPVVVKTDAVGAETKASVTFAEGEYGLTYTVQYSGSDKIKTYKTLPTEEAEWEWAKNAGTYIISVSFGGNEKYSPLAPVRLASVIVNQKELIFVVPELTEEFTAGQEIADVMYAAHRAFYKQSAAGVKAVEGDIPEADKKYFTKTEINGTTGFLAWYDEEDNSFGMPAVKVRDNANNAEYDLDDYGVLLQGTGNERYSLIGDYAAEGYDYLTDICGVNYAITAVEPAKGTPVKVVRGASAVTMEEYSGKKIDITDKAEAPKDASGSIVKEHIVTIQDGIAYYNSSSSSEKEGNIVRICIKAPTEYEADSSFRWNKVIYEQAIKNAAGDRLIGSITPNNSDKTLTFVYDATVRDKEDKEDLVFCVRWEEDYNEKFIVKFSESELLGNLMDAVAPKSLAFNAPLTTMVVGQEQELDVKIQKVQNADIICLGYEVTAGKEYIHVDEFGKVTALKDGGKATVEVFPLHLVDGKKVRIEGAKSAKTNITVKKVTAPKVTKVTPKDTSVTIEYTLPAK